MPKIDLKKENRELYNPSKKEVSIVNVPKMNFLMIDGQGDPNTSKEYKDAMEALFPVSYKTKFISKEEKSQDYVVMPLKDSGGLKTWKISVLMIKTAGNGR